MKYIKKPIAIEAITFDELVEHGRSKASMGLGTKRNDVPWSFFYQSHPITHETDDCYLIPTLEGTMRFNRGDMLITGVQGEIYPCKADIFEQTYEQAEEDERFLQAYVSKDTRVIGIDHQTEANWDTVLAAHVALRDRLCERIAEKLHCPHRPKAKQDEAAAPAFKKVYCDCDQATECPNGKTGSEDRCSIMRKVEPLQDATFEPAERPTFHQELVELINRHSIENRSNTPDWILGEYLIGCLKAYDLATHCREEYYGRPSPLTAPQEGIVS